MKQLDENALNVIVDGSSKPTPRRGGVGLVFAWVNDEGDEQTYEDSLPFSYEGATNNQMEIQALIEALKIARSRYAPVDPARFTKIVIHTDSLYVYENFSNAMYRWPTAHWTTKEGGPVLNTRQWKDLQKLVKRIRDDYRLKVQVEWVKGKKDILTKRVDKLAKKAADHTLKQRLGHQRVRRKWSPKSVEKGCIKMRGQEEIIRIVTDESLRSHKVYRYMYEVIDKDSTDYQSVDYIFSESMLNAGHIYHVRFNNNMGYPRIDESLAEIPQDEFRYEDYVRGAAGPW